MTVRQFLTLCMVFGLLCLPAAYLELRPFFLGAATQEARFDQVADGQNQTGLSTFSHRIALENCLEAVNSIFGRMQPTPRRQAVLSECDGLSDMISSTSVADSFAWYIGALTNSELGKVGEMNRRLVLSRRTGPNEQWVAELRVALGERRFADLDRPALEGHRKDLQLLALSARGVATIAKRYVAEPDFRARITSLVEELPEEVQSRFVTYVRQAAREFGF
jgi:hypothetical protein